MKVFCCNLLKIYTNVARVTGSLGGFSSSVGRRLLAGFATGLSLLIRIEMRFNFHVYQVVKGTFSLWVYEYSILQVEMKKINLKWRIVILLFVMRCSRQWLKLPVAAGCQYINDSMVFSVFQFNYWDEFALLTLIIGGSRGACPAPPYGTQLHTHFRWKAPTSEVHAP